MDGVELRAMVDGDLAAMDLLAAAVYGPGFEDAEAFAAKVAAGDAVVAVVNEAIVGYGVALPWRGPLPNLQARPAGRVADAEYVFVHDICVAPAARGAALGPAIMRHIESRAVAAGFDELQCIAVHGADVVWARLGWQPSGRPVPAEYPPDSVPMVRRLPGR